MNTRIEHDTMGEIAVPAEHHWGAQTQRSLENFKIGGQRQPQEIITAFAYLKEACAQANADCGKLTAEQAGAIAAVCAEIRAGRWNDEFPLVVWQTGSGTQTNMNCNEVICNLAAEHLGSVKGDYKLVSPNDHANFGQSTNDTYPTALHLALLLRSNVMLKAVEDLVEAYYKKADEFKGVLKMGRTHLQDAVPMTLGQEFHGWGFTIADELKTIREAQEHLKVLNLGGTAIGTTVTCHPDYPAKAVKHLSELTGIDFKNADDLIAATSDCGAYVAISSAMKSLAVKLTKVCNDIRLLASGPRCGLSELNLPQLQPGSSIMPGKVNPVIPEVTNQASFLAIGLDTTVMLAASAGQLELNVMEPVITFALFTGLRVLSNACNALRTKCVDGITVNAERTANMVMNSCGIVTLLKPHLGYKACSEMAHECYHTGKSLHQVVVEERHMLTQEEWDKTFNLQNLIAPKFVQ